MTAHNLETNPDPDNVLLRLPKVLEDEFRALHPDAYLSDADGTPGEDDRRKTIYEAIHGLEQKRWALCLSGGGIRSATFCLGVLQGLARSKLLGRFDYLSTVSGGGYIGSWLTAWIHRDGVPSVLRALERNQDSKLPPEREQIRHLRSYSNYLSPKMGLFSVDTWTLVAIYLRNLFLNWLVFLPLLIAVLLIPRMYASLMLRKFGSPGWLKCLDGGLFHALSRHVSVPASVQTFASSERMQAYVLLYLGLILGAVALAYVGAHRPSLWAQEDLPEEVRAADTDAGKTRADTQQNFLRWCLLPLILSILLVTIGRAWYLTEKASLNLWHFILGGVLLHTFGSLLTPVAVQYFFGRKVRRRYLRQRKLRLIELGIVILTGAIGGLLLWLLSIPEKISGYTPAEHLELYACFDGPQLLLVYLFMGILSVGLFGGRSMNDEDREWWARAGAWILIVAVLWAVINSLVLFVPKQLNSFWQGGKDTGLLMSTALKGVLVPFGIISGFVTILFGVSAKTPANERQAEKAGRITTIMDYAVKLAAPVFVLSLVVALSFFTDLLILLIKHIPNWHLLTNVEDFALSKLPSFNHHDVIANNSPFLFLAVLFAVLVLISAVMAWCINVNEFSLHSMYRNRLIRAYLGASRKFAPDAEFARKPNLFTGFDPTDDLRMYELWPNEEAKATETEEAEEDAGAAPGDEESDAEEDEKKKRLGTRHKQVGKPFHIVNMTWNLVQGKNLAWQNRKATTFTVSPLHCGNYLYGYRKSKYYGGASPESISLGTAFTISGAAASPNMGYYSSSAVTFLMALFNARLGWWLGNPSKQYHQKSGPRWALKPMIDEALGKTDEDKSYIYLSDGGHFENLGLYEMVLRRCHTIFVIDASSDPDRKFENLGNAIRRIRVDLGVPIEIMDIINFPEKQDSPKTYCAIGDIRYKQVDGIEGVADGVLIYIKPMLTGHEPTDVFNYAKANIKFPHESTSDQFFSEQQFESYRVLGSYTVEQIFNSALPTEENFRNLRTYLETYLKREQK